MEDKTKNPVWDAGYHQGCKIGKNEFLEFYNIIKNDDSVWADGARHGLIDSLDEPLLEKGASIKFYHGRLNDNMRGLFDLGYKHGSKMTTAEFRENSEKISKDKNLFTYGLIKGFDDKMRLDYAVTQAEARERDPLKGRSEDEDAKWIANYMKTIPWRHELIDLEKEYAKAEARHLANKGGQDAWGRDLKPDQLEYRKKLFRKDWEEGLGLSTIAAHKEKMEQYNRNLQLDKERMAEYAKKSQGNAQERDQKGQPSKEGDTVAPTKDYLDGRTEEEDAKWIAEQMEQDPWHGEKKPEPVDDLQARKEAYARKLMAEAENGDNDSDHDPG